MLYHPNTNHWYTSSVQGGIALRPLPSISTDKSIINYENNLTILLRNLFAISIYLYLKIYIYIERLKCIDTLMTKANNRYWSFFSPPPPFPTLLSASYHTSNLSNDYIFHINDMLQGKVPSPLGMLHLQHLTFQLKITCDHDWPFWDDRSKGNQFDFVI